MKVKELLKTTDIIKITPHDTLSSVLSQLESSHDAGFVFEEEKFIGVVNPYYAVIKKTYPSNTKVQSCLIHPPKIHLDDDMSKAARLMIESKLHYLPVVNEDHEFMGIISARRLLSQMVKTDDFSKEMHQKVGDKEIITIKGSDKLSKALSLFKDHKISKLVVVNDQGAIDGIVSQYDITDVVAAPKERAGSGMRTGNKDVQLDKPIRNFAKKHVSTLGEHAAFAEVAKQILEQKIGSIVIANAKRMPVGIVTTKDILSFMVPKEIQKGIEVSIKELNESDEKIVLNTVEALNKKLVQRGISKGHLVARGKHKGGIFEVTFSCIDEHGYISVHQEGQHLHDIMMELADKVTSRLDY